MNVINNFFGTVGGIYKEYHAYCNIAIGAVVFIVLFLLRNKLANGILKGLGKMLYKNEESKNSFIAALKKPLSVFFVILGLFIMLYLNVTTSPILKGFKIITILIICWGAMNFLSSNIIKSLNSGNSDEVINVTAVKFISNLIRIVVVALAVVMIISELGYNISGIITGLGVGGLAVSLAAQDAVKNLISGFIIVFDKPFKVGDFIQTKDITGTVLEVQMRSTKIRTLDDAVVTMPNSKLTDEAIVNISRMDKRLIDTEIGLVYSTDNELIEKCMKEIREYLVKDDEIINEPIRVEFKNFDDSALTICIFCYTTVTEINTFHKVLSRVNLNIKQIVENNNAEFAFPSTSVYIEKQ